MTRIRTYMELRRIETFEERFEYLKLQGEVGSSTFGFDRHMNQVFYKSKEWGLIRDKVIRRDQGCDLGIPGYEIHAKILIHHMNPISVRQIEDRDPSIMDVRFLICTTNRTHQAIHYGDASLLPQVPIDRRPGDTRLWG